MKVPGWTDRPHVAEEFRPYWSSFCAWAQWREWTPSSAVAWVGSQFHDLDAETRAVLVDVFMALVLNQRMAEAKPAPPTTNGGGPAVE